MKILKFTVALVTFFIILTSVSFAQQDNASRDSAIPKSVTMPAGSRFAAFGWKKFWWGKHWRDEWLKPVSFPVFNLDTTAGGLTPLEMGGGHETKTLRLLGNDGKEYVLRTIDKSLDVLIPDEYKGSFLNDLVNDQISTAHPYGPLVVAHLSGSIDILHTNPIITFVPDNPRLGEFRNEFHDKLCLFEERPSGKGWGHTNITGFADEIINTTKLYDKLQADHLSQVDQKSFLKVRLFDMLINDWDRHYDQWIWAGHKENGKTIYKAFARDRDQSLSKTDGVNLFLFSREWAIRNLQDMGPRVTDVIGINLSANFLDRQFMTELTETDWRNTIVELQQSLTDTVIGRALQQLPASIYPLSYDFLYRRLRQRRDDMMNFGMRYYHILNKQVTLIGTDQQELFTIDKLDNHTTEITILGLSKKNRITDTIYHRLFNDHTTKEINIYGLDGNDKFLFYGKAKNLVKVRVLGGEGIDMYSDSTGSTGKSKKSRIYDTPGNELQLSRSYKTFITADTTNKSYDRAGFKYNWWAPLILPSYNPDDGFLIGAGLIYKKQQWGKVPYGWQQMFGGNYAASTGAYSLFYKGIFKQALGKWDIDMAASYQAPTYVINFYGFGNDSKLLTTDKAFYRSHSKSISFNPGISRSWNKNTFAAGLLFNSYQITSDNDKFINPTAPIVDPAVFTNQYFTGINSSYTLNTTDSITYPTKGIKYTLGASYQRNVKNGQNDFGNIQSSFSFYYTPIKNITIAHRTGGATILGDFEYYQANTLGGTENLRGYWRTRFAGRSSFFQNTDIRWKLADLKGYVVRGGLGVYGFFDDGRVWYKDDHSNTIHTGYGAGIYFIPYNLLALNISYSCSKEVNVFAIRAGFLF